MPNHKPGMIVPSKEFTPETGCSLRGTGDRNGLAPGVCWSESGGRRSDAFITVKQNSPNTLNRTEYAADRQRRIGARDAGTW